MQEVVLAPLVISALFLIAFNQFITGDRNISTFQDNTYLLHPIFSHISRSFSHGEYPYWMNTIVAGLPLYNTPQFSITYPFFFFQSGLYSDPLNVLIQVHYVTLFHLFMLYLNTYFMLRVLRIASLPALLGASLFAFSPVALSYGTWINIVASYSWFPLVLASIFLILENRCAKAGVILGTFSFCLLILASPSQSLIHAVFVISILYTFHAIRCLKNKNVSALVYSTRNLVVMGALTLIISAPNLVIILLDTRYMIRFIGAYPAVIGYSKIPFEGFLFGQLKPVYLAGTLLPLEMPEVFGNPFIGMGSILLALFGIFKARSNWIVLPLLFISLYALLSSTGSYLGFAQLNYQLPLINKIREPPRHLFLFVLSVSILAAFGFNYLIEALDRGYRALLTLKHLIVVGLFLTLVVISFSVDITYKGNVSKLFLLGIWGLNFGMLLLLPLLNNQVSKALMIVAVLLILYANLQYPRDLPRLQDGDYFSAANLASHETLDQIAKLEDVRNYRIIFADNRLNSQFWSMNASYYDLRSFQAYMNPLPNKQFEEVFQRFNLHNYYPLLGAKYYLCTSCDNELLRDYSFQREINGYKLYVADRALPRYTLVSRVAGYYEHPGDFYNKINKGYDYANEVYLDKSDVTKVQNWLGKQLAPLNYVLKEEYTSLNKLRLSVNTEQRAIFLLNEYYSENWKARENGIPIKPIKINLNQTGILLEKGANLIEFEYYPSLFVWLLWVQRITVFSLALYILYSAITSHLYRVKRSDTRT